MLHTAPALLAPSAATLRRPSRRGRQAPMIEEEVTCADQIPVHLKKDDAEDGKPATLDLGPRDPRRRSST